MFPSSGACRFYHSSCVNTAGIRQTSICESCWKDAGRMARVGGGVTPRNTLPLGDGPLSPRYSARAQAGTQMSGAHQRFLRDGAAQITSFDLRDSGRRDIRSCSAIGDSYPQTTPRDRSSSFVPAIVRLRIGSFLYVHCSRRLDHGRSCPGRNNAILDGQNRDHSRSIQATWQMIR